VTAASHPARPSSLCGNPTLIGALVEAHVGPTRRHPRADVVVWLCPACALEATCPARRRGTPRGGG
jgi:hypothetical protein